MVQGAWRAAGHVWRRMGRVKTVTSGVMETPLSRCLTTMDITLLGIGHMFGAGIYVLTGTVARDTAGPAIIFSFLLAGFASFLAALCYAEFGARVPKAGSAYVYTYVTIGEFWAFVIGWNVILEYMIGAASVARAWSGYIDSLFDGAIRNSTIETFGSMHNSYLAPYIDPLAFTVTLVYCGLLSVGVKCSTHINSAFTVINMAVVVFVIVFGMYWADLSNWQGTDGFAPYGMTGIVAGAATCFYAFVGFDSIATASEEARDPARSVPIATLVSMAVVTCAYILVGATLTLMVPFREIHIASALPDAFAANNVVWAKYVVSIGALCGMTTTLFGALFTMPRCVYAMACDGLLFSRLSVISDKTKLPVLNMMICGLMSAIIALIFDIEKLVEFMSIGTLMAYTIVSASVIILRYQPQHKCNIKTLPHEDAAGVSEVPPTPATPYPPEENGEGSCEGGSLRPMFRWVSLVVGIHEPGVVVCWAVVVFTVLSASLCLLVQYGMGNVMANTLLHNEEMHQLVLTYPDLAKHKINSLGGGTQDWAIVLAVFISSLLVTATSLIWVHAQNSIQLSFKVPLVPFVPLASIFANMAFMVHLNPMTWLRFAVWMTAGLLVYFCYGIHHSRENEPLSSYTTLLAPGTAPPTTSTVVSAVQNTISQVTSKVASLPASFKGKDKNKYTDLETSDERPILQESGAAEHSRDQEGF